MFCPKCGSQVNEGSKFCPTCGNAVNFTQAAQPEPQPQPQAAPVQPAIVPQPTYNAGAGYNAAPVVGGPIATDRNTLTWFLLSLVTCGIYGYYFNYCLARDLNIICAGDGEETPGIGVYIALCIVTCGLYNLYWEYKFANRMQMNAPRYGLAFQENGTTVLLWAVIGSLICGLGTIFAENIIIKNMNAISRAYNATVYGY